MYRQNRLETLSYTWHLLWCCPMEVEGQIQSRLLFTLFYGILCAVVVTCQWLTSRNGVLSSWESIQVISLNMRSIIADVSKCLKKMPRQSSWSFMYSITSSGLLAKREPTVLLKKLARSGFKGGLLSRNFQSFSKIFWKIKRKIQTRVNTSFRVTTPKADFGSIFCQKQYKLTCLTYFWLTAHININHTAIMLHII